MTTSAERLAIDVGDAGTVGALLLRPAGARAGFVLAHGAGAGMTHPFLGALAGALAQRGVATLRFQFPFAERGSKRPDPPRVAHAAVRAAVACATQQLPGLPLVAGGKSFGGRMTSQAHASTPLPGVHGLAFVGFPLHPPGRVGDERAAHLADVGVPMLFLQGTRDELAQQPLVERVVERLGPRATLHVVDDADHGFHVPARSGRRDADVVAELTDVLVGWIDRVTPR